MQNRDVLEAVVWEFIGSGEWPRRSSLQRVLATQHSPPPDLARIFSRIPEPLGLLAAPGDRIVLTVFGLSRTAAGRPILEGLVLGLRLAVDRYRNETDPAALTWQDLVADPELAVKLWRATGEVLLREAPFLGGGSGGPHDDWHREISEVVVRYWNVRTVDDYLRVRGRELGGHSQLRAGPTSVVPPARATVAQTETVPDAQPMQPRLVEGELESRSGVPPGVTIAVSVLAMLSGGVSFLLDSPRFVTVAVFAFAITAGVVWWRGFAWPPAAMQLLTVIGITTAVTAGVELAKHLTSEESAKPRAPQLRPTDRKVDAWVAELRDRLGWVGSPTFYGPSVAYFKRHFAELDPARPHKFDLDVADVTTDVPSLAERAPQLSGRLVQVTGRLEFKQQVTLYAKAASWAFLLRDRAAPRIVAWCRVPLAPGAEDDYEIGDRIHANGLLLADGVTPRTDGRGQMRTVYLFCSSISRTMATIRIGPNGVSLKPGR
jgi:hypothetical protein